MKCYTLRFRQINQDTFKAIKSGLKKIETRAASARYQNIEVGDKIIFKCGDQAFKRDVKAVYYFRSLTAMLKKFHYQDINPYVKSAKQLRDKYKSFPKYQEKLKKYGLVALEFRK